MRIPCKSCDCMMISITKEAMRYKCPGCGRAVTIRPLYKKNSKTGGR